MRGLTVWLPEDVTEAVRRDSASRGLTVSAELRRIILDLAYPPSIVESGDPKP